MPDDEDRTPRRVTHRLPIAIFAVAVLLAVLVPVLIVRSENDLGPTDASQNGLTYPKDNASAQGGGGSGSAPTAAVVRIADGGPIPTDVQITGGGRIEFTNKTKRPLSLRFTTPMSPAPVTVLQPGQVIERTFPELGTYRYESTSGPAFKGSVFVS